MPSKLPHVFEKVAGPVGWRAIERLRLPTYLRVIAAETVLLQHAAGCDENDGRVDLAHGLGKLVVFQHEVLVSVRPICQEPQGSLPMFQNLMW